MKDSFKVNLSSIPFELTLLLKALNTSNDEEVKEIIQRYRAEINWNRLIQLSNHHRLYPLIYLRSKNLGFPNHVVEALFGKYQNNIYRMLHLSAETETLANLFYENNIPAIFLKGTVLAHELYGDISLRTSSDLDLLVQISDLEKVDKNLIRLGFVKDDYIHTVLNDWKWRHHHFTYFHSEKGIKVEIHWRLNPGPAKEPPFQELWERKRTSKFTNFPVYLLGKEDLFLFLVSHGARHGWSRLRWLADIDRIIGQGLDNRKTIGLLKKYQYLHIAGQAILLSSALFQTQLTREFTQIASTSRSEYLAKQALYYFEKQVSLHTEPVPNDVARYHKRHLFELMSYQQKVLFLLSILYPYPIDAETFPLPKVLHFLYFPLHPMLWAWRKMRKQALP